MSKFLLPVMLVLTIPVSALAEGAFVKDKHGCQLMEAEADETLAYDWKGKCKAGYAEGKGILLADRLEHPYKTEEVTFRKGLREGHSSLIFLNGEPLLRVEREYAHGLRNGKSVAYLKSGEVIELNFVDDARTSHIIVTEKDGTHFEGDEDTETPGNASGRLQYANGDVYEGTTTYGARNGKGKFTRKGEQPQVGEFILDEFVDVKDEAINDLMPAKFGLELGMTKKQVEALTGPMTESASSMFRNAYEVKHFPNEKINAPNMTLGERAVYFDEDGKLWRIWAEILLKENTFFGGGEVMQAYGTFKKWLSQKNDPIKSVEAYPHYQEDVSSCNGTDDWKKDNPESYDIAQQMAPTMAHSQRVIFDIGCGAIKLWNSEYLRKDGKERAFIAIRYGNLYATPLAYIVAIPAEEEMSKKMWKTAEQKSRVR